MTSLLGSMSGAGPLGVALAAFPAIFNLLSGEMSNSPSYERQKDITQSGQVGDYLQHIFWNPLTVEGTEGATFPTGPSTIPGMSDIARWAQSLANAPAPERTPYGWESYPNVANMMNALQTQGDLQALIDRGTFQAGEYRQNIKKVPAADIRSQWGIQSPSQLPSGYGAIQQLMDVARMLLPEGAAQGTFAREKAYHEGSINDWLSQPENQPANQPYWF